MNIPALDIPELTSDLAEWLENHLVGLHLGTLVAELLAVHGESSHKPLEELLGHDLPRVLQSGLSELSRSKLEALLRHPTVLLELQERVVIEGGPHWEARAQANSEIQQQVAVGWRRLQAAIGGHQSMTAPRSSESVSGGGSALTRRLAVMSMAAMVLVAFGLWRFQQFNSPEVAWGWAKPGAIPQIGTDQEYLARLADGADQWFKKTPETEAELHKRLDEFRLGCEALLKAEHRPLTQVDKDWLQAKCRAWKGKIEGHLADLKMTGDVATVRKAANETVQKLSAALRERKAA